MFQDNMEREIFVTNSLYTCDKIHAFSDFKSYSPKVVISNILSNTNGGSCHLRLIVVNLYKNAY